MGDPFCPGEKNAAPCRTHRAEDEAEALWPVPHPSWESAGPAAGEVGPMAFWAQAGAMSSSPSWSEGDPQQSQRVTKQRQLHSPGPEFPCERPLHVARLGTHPGLLAIFRHHFHLSCKHSCLCRARGTASTGNLLLGLLAAQSQAPGVSSRYTQTHPRAPTRSRH